VQILATPHAGGLPVGFLCIAGGGGGGMNGSGGGGGAGGLRCSVDQTGGLGTLETMFTPTLGVTYTIVVGAGGAGGVAPTTSEAVNGSNSSIIGTGVSITSTGGGKGGTAASSDGGNGGSGGGAGGGGSALNAGTRTASPVQGFDGGANNGSSPFSGAGGGGAGAVGVAGGNSGLQPDGGVGIQTTIETGVATYYAGGGGAGKRGSIPAAGVGGLGGGGNGSNTSANGIAGTVNTGSGGGSGSEDAGSNGGAGGSGVVIINTGLVAVSTTGSPTLVGTTYKFTGSGSITF